MKTQTGGQHAGFMTKASLKIRVVPAISDIAAQDWNGCACPRSDRPPAASSHEQPSYNPFVFARISGRGRAFPIGYAAYWLAAPAPGLPNVTTAALPGSCPVTSSLDPRGRTVFDRGWAEAYENAGGGLLPQATGLGPFTPRDRSPPAGEAGAGRG